MAAVDVGSRCTCNNSLDGVGRRTCVACGRLAGSGIIDGDVDGLDETGASVFLPRQLIAGFISGALTGVFAIGT